MRTGGSFGVILDAIDRQVTVTHAFQCLVIEIDMGGFKIGGH